MVVCSLTMCSHWRCAKCCRSQETVSATVCSGSLGRTPGPPLPSGLNVPAPHSPAHSGAHKRQYCTVQPGPEAAGSHAMHRPSPEGHKACKSWGARGLVSWVGKYSKVQYSTVQYSTEQNSTEHTSGGWTSPRGQGPKWGPTSQSAPGRRRPWPRCPAPRGPARQSAGWARRRGAPLAGRKSRRDRFCAPNRYVASAYPYPWPPQMPPPALNQTGHNTAIAGEKAIAGRSHQHPSTDSRHASWRACINRQGGTWFRAHG